MSTYSQPIYEVPTAAKMSFGGIIGDRILANESNWLMIAPESNPAMLQVFRDRDRQHSCDLLPWHGEFPGKYLISAVQSLRITQNPALKAKLERFVHDLISCQDTDGYFGPFAKDKRLFGTDLWDLWGHYHCMLGLYLWYRDTGDKRALEACTRTADFLCSIFLDGGRRTVEAGWHEMNQAIIHIFLLLHTETKNDRYLEMAREIEKDWQTPPCGDYLRCGLENKAFYESPKPRWESLPDIQALAELYYIAGDENYKKAFENLWWSISKLDRHNSGGFSSGEQAVGNPYDLRAIETCCTIAWMALCVDMLRLTGDCRAADELELATFNAVIGAQNAPGRWWTYNTPMDGERKASAHEIVFQARAGSSELNCCSVNGPRGLGMLSEWAVMTAEDGLVVNYYGPCEFEVKTHCGSLVKLSQSTNYPLDGNIVLHVDPDTEEHFTLKLRVPSWSKYAQIWLNEQEVEGVRNGEYLSIDRVWKSGDMIRLSLDMSLRTWVGAQDCEGKVSIYRGPILLAYDPRFDCYDIPDLPTIDLRKGVKQIEPPVFTPKPILLLSFTTMDGNQINLCDFCSAGASGNSYVSWVKASGVQGDCTPFPG
ncbi:glycoside hydrolase family 127 protein [bacterium]|nr:glycoside hydrolase family 127 protein [bacterium]